MHTRNFLRYLLIFVIIISCYNRVWSQEDVQESTTAVIPDTVFETSSLATNDSVTSTNVSEEILTSHLLQSAAEGNIEGVIAALADANEDVNTVNDNGWSAVMFAVGGGQINIIEELTARGADIDLPNNDGYTPLMIAVLNNDKVMIESLLNLGASPIVHRKLFDGSEETVLDLAIYTGKLSIQALIIDGIIQHSIVQNDLPMIFFALERGGDVEHSTSSGWTPLILAAALGELEAVKRLVTDFRADPRRSELSGWNPLHFAANNNHIEVVKYLLEIGVNPRYLNADGKSARDLAINSKHTEVVELLNEVLSREL